MTSSLGGQIQGHAPQGYAAAVVLRVSALRMLIFFIEVTSFAVGLVATHGRDMTYYIKDRWLKID
ncbi:MAG: hypothetical protein JOZ51_01665 [Chloroflexi bacterium]|nr:hypothetical protein [Chloroflexota bacterium]